jgi:hypothetical protein
MLSSKSNRNADNVATRVIVYISEVPGKFVLNIPTHTMRNAANTTQFVEFNIFLIRTPFIVNETIPSSKTINGNTRNMLLLVKFVMFNNNIIIGMIYLYIVIHIKHHRYDYHKNKYFI